MSNMTDQIVSFELAKLAKEKEFNIECRLIYSDTGNYLLPEYITANNRDPEHSMCCTAPTQTLLQRWLREEYSLHITITPIFDYLTKTISSYRFNYFNRFGSEMGYDNVNREYKTYELALEAGLTALLNSLDKQLNSSNKWQRVNYQD